MKYTPVPGKKVNIKIILSLIGLVLSAQVFAQVIVDTSKQKIDSLSITKFNSDSVKKYFRASDTLIAYQLSKIEAYTLQTNKVNNTLRRGFDTSSISNGISQIDSIISIAKTNLTGFRGHTSLKILFSTKRILVQNQKVLAGWQDRLSAYNNSLNTVKEQMNLIRKDSDLLIMPTDSLLFVEYIKKLKPLGQKIDVIDSSTTSQLKALGVLQNKVSSNYLATSDLLDETSYQINNFSERIFDNEFGYIWDYKRDSTYTKDFKTVIRKSIQESGTLFKFYFATNWPSRIIVLLIGIFFYSWMKHNINRIKKLSEAPKIVFSKASHIPQHLFNSTVVFTLMLIPYIYYAAPQVFTQSLWVIQIIALVLLIRNKLNFTVGMQIFFLLVLFFTTGFTNLLIETTYAERWIQFMISILSIVLGTWLLFSKRESHFFRSSIFKPLMIIFITMNVAALGLNIIGRVTLAKVLNTGANYGALEALNLVVFVEIIIDAVYLSMEARKKNSTLTPYFEFKGIENWLRKGLGLFAGFLWLVIFTQSLHIYDAIFGSITAFLSTEQHIGNMTFSFGSIVIFIFVIWISGLLSKIVSLIFSDREITPNGDTINKLGSSMLLVRLSIIAAGIILAFGASGIPLDKLTIVIGALGVGIGFGLQGIVNNLVSGIVLAFEKPIKIGDIIEVGDRSGTVKEIGVRSSKLTTYDGSEVIVPNGDMLSQHLINWTRNNNNRRVQIPVGVAYGSDIEKVKEIILQILKDNQDVLKFPEPLIRFQNFGDNSVNMDVFFWAHIDKWLALKSEIFANIYTKLNAEGISIPFPQRDLHIKSIDGGVLNEIIDSKKNDGA